MNAINAPPSESIEQKWDDLSPATKIGIICAIGGVFLILALLCTVCCVRQRKVGRREREIADADWDRANSEMMAYRQQMQRPNIYSPNPFSDSKTDLNPSSYNHGEYGMTPLSPNPQYAPKEFR